MTEPSPYPPPPAFDAYSALAVPAVLLMITAAIGMAWQFFGMAWNVLALMGVVAAPQFGEMPQEMQAFQALSGGLGIIFNVIGILIGVIVLLGAIKMKNLQAYGFAMTSAILALVPCVSPCCLLGFPVGIWALVVLSKQEVKAAFRM